MGDNKYIETGKVRIIDPNNFNYQYDGNIFGERKMNMSVPNEDLCIIVELKTNTKSRTILNTKEIVNSKISQSGSSISFINGTNNRSTGNQNYLTTQYTELGTELTELDESLGISNIDIEFNSNVAPMVNITFIDVKGGALFQPGGESRYNVLFRLPYPLFELKIKGYYGKPVTYCLHLIKCRVKFNSQTGNFELDAQFVGYTYAMLADMNMGYLKAAVITEEGKRLLKNKKTIDGQDMISINEFISKMGNIDQTIRQQLNESSENTNNLSLIKELQETLNQLNAAVKNAIATLGINYPLEGESKNQNIVIVHDPNAGNQDKFEDFKNFRETIPSFNTTYGDLIKTFNERGGDSEDLKLQTNLGCYQLIANLSQMFVNDAYPQSFLDRVKKQYSSHYDVNNSSVLNTIISRLKNAVPEGVTPSDRYVKFYDFTDIVEDLNAMEATLTKKEEDVSKLVAEELRKTLTSKLGFDPTIRNTIMMLTSHVEVFLELLFNVSAKYKDQTRLTELEIFKTNNSKSTATDIDDDVKKDGMIYPWPLYINNGVEAYLGSKKGPLKNPLNVPEIKFVEELYEAMITVNKQQDEITTEGPKSWYSLSPTDSFYYTEIKPYDRLDAAAKPDDIVRLVMLRAIGFLGFSNYLLSTKEIEAFAKAEADAVLKKYESQQTVLQAIKNFSFDKFTDATGVINNNTSKILTLNGDVYEYSYINESIVDSNSPNGVIDRYVLPVDKGFTNAIYTLTDQAASDNKLTSFSCTNKLITDNAKYIDFIASDKYEGKTAAPPLAEAATSFSYTSLKIDSDTEYTTSNINSAGFLANNGKYGVQEYRLINYNGTDYGVEGDLDFFSLFYDNREIDKKKAWYLPAISTKRAIESTDWDLEKPNFRTQIFDVSESDLNDSINSLYSNYENSGKNLDMFKFKSNQDQLTYPFLQFGCDNIDWASYIPLSSLFQDNYFNQLDLFTSRFYNAQNLDAKAFLFLHCFPWRGIYSNNDEDTSGIFKQQEILNVFKYRTGFIQVPKLWPAFIGGLLWRYTEGEKGKDPVIFKINNENLLPNVDDDNTPPHTAYLKYSNSKLPMAFNGFYSKDDYLKLEDELIKLPAVVKEQFINEFKSFVTSEFSTLRKSFEVLPKNASADYDSDGNNASRDTQWKTAWNSINNSTSVDSENNDIGTNKLANINAILKTSNEKSLVDRYKIFSYWTQNNGSSNLFNYNYITEFKQNGDADNELKNLFFSYKYIANNSWFMWNQNWISKNTCSGKVSVSNSDLTAYINKFLENIKTSVEQKEKTFFDNNENEQIKLEIYRKLKKIYDSWIADTTRGSGDTVSNDILFQCCKLNTIRKDGRLPKDEELSRKRGDNTPKLIDSFRFITKAYRDIGNIFILNPLTISKLLLESGSNSFYDVVGRIMDDNKFTFVALPNFINYNDPKELQSIFTPYPYYEIANETTTGPSFVCVYAGQSSTKLDFGKNSEYPDDGFNFTDTDKNGNVVESPTIPDEYTQKPEAHEDMAAVFIVRYGHQNQNIFKDISIDQSEFNQTFEEINVVDALANKFSQSDQTFVGQNLYDIHSIRSYTAEIEMMGDAMIQPMMYFQLDNIPMFRGAYLITKVKHNIKPNYMTTNFNGVRVNRYQTPLVDAATIFSSMLKGYELPKPKVNSSINNISGGKYPPIIITIQENTGTNGNIEQGKITRTAIDVPAGVGVTIDSSDNRKILTEAVAPLKAMLTEWVSWMKSNGFKGSGGKYVNIISAYRTLQDQERVKADAIAKGKPKGSYATPGSSRHGWGIAIDFNYFDKDGNLINNYINKGRTINDKVGFDISKNQSIKWLFDNAYRFGFIIPEELRDNVGTEEFWHWEYHGTAAKCILQKNPNIRNYRVIIDKNYDPSVTNPKKPDGTVAVYTGCDFVNIKEADGTTTTTLQDDTLLWMYLSWQQGANGASQHYNVANGKRASYGIKPENIIANWPSGAISDDGVKASDITRLYYSDPKRLANAFINVWSKTIAKKADQAIKLIEGSGKNRTQKQYLGFKDVFKKYEKPDKNISWTDIASMGFIENALNTDTDPNETYQSMFQMNKGDSAYKPTLNAARRGASGYKNFIDYDLDKTVEGFVTLAIERLNEFRRNTGYTG